MSISALKFANGITYTDNYNEKAGSTLDYRQANTGYIKTSYFVNFSLEHTAGASDFKVKKLFTYANGNYVGLKYSLYANEYLTQYYLDAEMNVYDKNDNIIQQGSRTQSTYSWSSEGADFKTVPCTDMYYVPSEVSYDDSHNNTVPNQESNGVYPWGRIYMKAIREPLGGYISSFKGTYDRIEFFKSYAPGISENAVLNDNNLNTFFTTLDNSGDGTPWKEIGPEPEDPDPSGTGGGDKPKGDTGDPVDFPGLPTVSVIDTGMLRLFNPTTQQLQSLATKLWSNDFYNTIQKVMNDPFDGVIGLSMVPFSPTVAGSINCFIGNYDTEVSMSMVSAQFMTLDCGSINIEENWENALDYNSTSIEIFIPFAGFKSLDIQDCMDKTLSLKYNVDVLTGSGVAILKADDKVLYTYPVNLSYEIPLTGSNKQALYTGMINTALTGLGGLASGGAMGAVMGAATSAINTATHAQSDVERSGGIVSNTSMMSEFTPYVVIHRPVQSLADNFKTYKGYQSNVTSILGNCRGYTEVEYIHLKEIDFATDSELKEIESLLKEGVII